MRGGLHTVVLTLRMRRFLTRSVTSTVSQAILSGRACQPDAGTV